MLQSQYIQEQDYGHGEHNIASHEICDRYYVNASTSSPIVVNILRMLYCYGEEESACFTPIDLYPW